MSVLSLVASYLEKISQGQHVLYIVHPDSILEQSANIKHVKPFLDKLRGAVSSFSGPVLVTKLDSTSFQSDFGTSSEILQGEEYVKEFMIWVSSKAKVIEESRRQLSVLGSGPMGQMLDDMFLTGQIDKIILAGCFTGSSCSMCVDDTYKSLVQEYGSEKVEIDQNLTMKAGPVFPDFS